MVTWSPLQMRSFEHGTALPAGGDGRQRCLRVARRQGWRGEQARPCREGGMCCSQRLIRFRRLTQPVAGIFKNAFLIPPRGTCFGISIVATNKQRGAAIIISPSLTEADGGGPRLPSSRPRHPCARSHPDPAIEHTEDRHLSRGRRTWPPPDSSAQACCAGAAVGHDEQVVWLGTELEELAGAIKERCAGLPFNKSYLIAVPRSITMRHTRCNSPHCPNSSSTCLRLCSEGPVHLDRAWWLAWFHQPIHEHR